MGLEPELLEALSTKAEVWRKGAGNEDEYGNSTSAYVLFSSLYGRFEFLTGSENLSSEETAIYRQRFIIDGDNDVTEADQLRFADGRKFNISTVYIRHDWDGTEHHRVVYLEEIV